MNLNIARANQVNLPSKFLSAMKDKLLNWLNILLMADVFFVLLSFIWFAIALVGRSIGVSLGFDLWYSLWEPVFTPAIGILMAGSIIVGIINWISRRFSSDAVK